MPVFTVAVTDPSASSALSSLVEMVSVALPVVGMLTVCEPVVTPKSPLWATLTLTNRADAGTGLAVTVKVALPPSVMSFPAAMLISGASSFSTPTVAADAFSSTVYSTPNMLCGSLINSTVIEPSALVSSLSFV